MKYKCSECGRVHDELPRFFMRKLPETADGSTIHVKQDHKSMCRTEDRTFVRCEIEVPIAGAAAGPLGFIVWVEVASEDYQRLLVFRRNEKAEPDFSTWLEGTLANPVSAVPESVGTPVKFEVRKGDPTPYITWVAPGTSLAALLETGASVGFWHDVAEGRFDR